MTSCDSIIAVLKERDARRHGFFLNFAPGHNDGDGACVLMLQQLQLPLVRLAFLARYFFSSPGYNTYLRYTYVERTPRLFTVFSRAF